MKIDYEYLKGLLEAFEKAVQTYTNVEELKKNGYYYYEDKFIFHTDIFIDKRLIQVMYPEPNSLQGWNAEILLRLTADGHDFLAAIRDPYIWKDIKKFMKLALSL